MGVRVIKPRHDRHAFEIHDLSSRSDEGLNIRRTSNHDNLPTRNGKCFGVRILGVHSKNISVTHDELRGNGCD